MSRIRDGLDLEHVFGYAEQATRLGLAARPVGSHASRRVARTAGRFFFPREV